jgi:hypothetical protein
MLRNLRPSDADKRLDKLRSRGRNVGWVVEEEFNSLWYAAALDEHQGE